jgi:hypothetical protein
LKIQFIYEKHKRNNFFKVIYIYKVVTNYPSAIRFTDIIKYRLDSETHRKKITYFPVRTYLCVHSSNYSKETHCRQKAPTAESQATPWFSGQFDSHSTTSVLRPNQVRLTEPLTAIINFFFLKEFPQKYHAYIFFNMPGHRLTFPTCKMKCLPQQSNGCFYGWLNCHTLKCA